MPFFFFKYSFSLKAYTCFNLSFYEYIRCKKLYYSSIKVFFDYFQLNDKVYIEIGVVFRVQCVADSGLSLFVVRELLCFLNKFQVISLTI